MKSHKNKTSNPIKGLFPFCRIQYFKDNFVKSKYALQIFVSQNLNNDFYSCSVNHNQLLQMHLWDSPPDTSSLQVTGNLVDT